MHRPRSKVRGRAGLGAFDTLQLGVGRAGAAADGFCVPAQLLHGAFADRMIQGRLDR
jgi:hypothetical protein